MVCVIRDVSPRKTPLVSASDEKIESEDTWSLVISRLFCSVIDTFWVSTGPVPLGRATRSEGVPVLRSSSLWGRVNPICPSLSRP